MHAGQPSLTTYLIIVLVVAVALVLRGRRLTAQRPLKPGTLWLVPVLFLLLTASTLLQFPPRPHDWPWLALALAAGMAVGWQRGRLMTIRAEPETGRLMVQGSRWAFILLVGLVVIRLAARGTLDMEVRAGIVGPALINDGFVLFALGLFATQRAEMALRARRLIRRRKADASG